jgi:hypothetical protein
MATLKEVKFASCHPDRKYHAKDRCRECYIRDWRLENLERCKQYERNNYDSAKRVEGVRRWRANNPDKYAAQKTALWSRMLIHGARASSRRRSHPEPTIDFTYVEHLFELQKGRCYWTGLPMEPSAVRHAPLRPSLDRLDASRGYEHGNVVLTAMFINFARSELSAVEFAELLRKLRDSLNAHLAREV